MPHYFAIFLFFLVAVVPFIAIWDIRRKMTRQERRDLKRHEKPSLYLTAGICITGVASTLLLIFVVGFLLPGLGWIDPNALSEIPIHIPSGSRWKWRRNTNPYHTRCKSKTWK